MLNLFVDWKDLIEISFLVSSIYYFSIWLAKDSNKNLILPFYLYISGFIVSHYLNLNIISNILFFGSPIVLTIFILFHQRILQKNFIASQKANFEKQEQYLWLDELMKSSLTAINKNCDMTFVIERKDNLQDFIVTDWNLNAYLKKELFDLILNQQNNELFIWIKDGTLISYTAQWAFLQDETHKVTEKNLENWKQDALIITHQTDCIVIKTLHEERQFQIVIEGKIFEPLNALQTLTLLERYLQPSSEFKKIKGIKHVRDKKYFNQQQA
ncbi:hypothetical protein M1446_00040 [Candidatus Dependentiae bacterium]|nr:hypothetical protein [Candidatus Dependentiae bacterium]